MLGPSLLHRSALALVVGAALMTPATQQLHYHLKLTQRDTTGNYAWVGRVTGAVNGRATVTLQFQGTPADKPAEALVQSRWIVRATPDSDSFEASLSGTIDIASGETHLVGAIVKGAGRGQEIETRSQLLNLGPNGTMSDADGAITIFPPVRLTMISQR
jgi:hypothetical protein